MARRRLLLPPPCRIGFGATGCEIRRCCGNGSGRLVDLGIEALPGRKIAIVGANGAEGRRCCAWPPGLSRPNAAVALAGREQRDRDAREWRRTILAAG
jgi:hypothetical protein